MRPKRVTSKRRRAGARDDAVVDKIARTIIADLETSDVYEIARRSNIAIDFGQWFPVTLGEFDRKNRRIMVNRNAGIPAETIIAHELGHYFLEDHLPREHGDIEGLCDRFAEGLLK